MGAITYLVVPEIVETFSRARCRRGDRHRRLHRSASSPGSRSTGWGYKKLMYAMLISMALIWIRSHISWSLNKTGIREVPGGEKRFLPMDAPGESILPSVVFCSSIVFPGQGLPQRVPPGFGCRSTHQYLYQRPFSSYSPCCCAGAALPWFWKKFA